MEHNIPSSALEDFFNHIGIDFNVDDNSVVIDIKTDEGEKILTEQSKKYGFASLEEYLKFIVNKALKIKTGEDENKKT